MRTSNVRALIRERHRPTTIGKSKTRAPERDKMYLCAIIFKKAVKEISWMYRRGRLENGGVRFDESARGLLYIVFPALCVIFPFNDSSIN